MPLPSSAPATEVAASSLLIDTTALALAPEATCRLVHTPLRDGVEAMLWRGCTSQPIEMKIRDDSGRIHFSHAAIGRSECGFDGGTCPRRHVLEENSASINFNPDRRGWFSQSGSFESVTVMVRPDVFAEWDGETCEAIRRNIASGDCFVRGPGSAELRSTAQSLGRALATFADGSREGPRRSTLWMLGQALSTVALVLESQVTGSKRGPCDVNANDRRRLLKARDRLLSDLSAAPTIAELAREVGLSVLKLKRGFRQVFDHSVYGLFQHERMHEARRLLCGQGTPVMVVASELGYTNASHFAAAFHKQFGIKPSALKRGT